MRYIDEQIEELKRKLAEILKSLEEVRLRAEQERKVKSVLVKVLGSSLETPATVIELKNLKLLINPTAENELALLEQLTEALNNKILQLQAVKKDLEPLATGELTLPIKTVFIDGIPRGIIIKF